MKIDYNTLTEEQLVEFVEFIDWSTVPSCLLNEKVTNRFSPVFKGLQVRMWLEELVASFVIKVDEKAYPNCVFFLKEEEVYMVLDGKTGELHCSYDRVWSVIKNEFGLNHNDKIKRYIKNVMEMHFKNMEVTPLTYSDISIKSVEMHFKNKKA